MNAKVSRHELAKVITAKLLAEPGRRSEWLQALAAYLVDHKMTEQVDLVVNDIAHELLVQHGHLVVEVTSARVLSDALRSNLTAFLKDKTGAQDVQLHESTDPNLIGGLVARTPDAELDISVRRSLQQLAAVA